MKQFVDVDTEGLEILMGEIVTIMCVNYFYTGKLVGVNKEYVKLEDPKVVFETGPFDKNDWQDAQSLPEKHWYVMVGAIESFGVMKK